MKQSTDYKHNEKIISGSGKESHELLPHIHLVISLVKRWISGTHQGKMSPKYLEYYLDEFAFRFKPALFIMLQKSTLIKNPKRYFLGDFATKFDRIINLCLSKQKNQTIKALQNLSLVIPIKKFFSNNGK